MTNISAAVVPMDCSSSPGLVPTCTAYLYNLGRGRSVDEAASVYAANVSLSRPIARAGGAGAGADYLIAVPCTCDSAAYFHTTTYTVQPGDTYDVISNTVFNGQAYGLAGRGPIAGEVIRVRLPCGCAREPKQTVATYTVQPGDTLVDIAGLFSTDVNSVVALNPKLAADPGFLKSGWVLFVDSGPLPEVSSPPPPSQKASNNRDAWIYGISLAGTLLIAIGVILTICKENKSKRDATQNPEDKMEKGITPETTPVLEKQNTNKEIVKEVQDLESERPVSFRLEELKEATNNFNENRKIGEGGYGSVYYGIVREQEVAIKKMKSSMSKEFFAELKVLCKVHHINVVELIGYARGDDHLYLVYEYVQRGSLSEHLHDPLLKDHQPLSWNARAQIALDSARGIEYIHDHTKARYVHRDIKSTNILLDISLRAKVADFGLVKLVDRSDEEDCQTKNLVGTLGYMAPESVRELLMTTKTDVFAFGVVLAELITGHLTLIRDNKEPTKTKSLISIVKNVFQEEDPEHALEGIVDGNLKGCYPMEGMFKMAEISSCCLRDDPITRPEMGEITVKLSQIVMASTEWEASLGGNSQVFSGVFSGR